MPNLPSAQASNRHGALSHMTWKDRPIHRTRAGARRGSPFALTALFPSYLHNGVITAEGVGHIGIGIAVILPTLAVQ